MSIDKLLKNLGIPGAVVIAILGFSLLVYIIAKISAKIIERKLKPIAEMLNGEIKSSFIAGTYISILNYGPEIRFKLTLGGKDSPAVLALELLSPVGFNFRIIRKQVINQMFSRWGGEVKLGDETLDEEYLIRSDKPEEASFYLSYSKRIDAIKYFFGNNFTEIKANAKGVYASKINYNELDLAPEKVGAYFDNLNSFTRM